MSLYPPLTNEQLAALQQRRADLDTLRNLVTHYRISPILDPGDEDRLLREVSELRGHLAGLDLALFRTYDFVHRMKESNVPTHLPEPRARPSVDSLMELMK